MLTIIVEDCYLHQGLFPGPGTTQNDETGSNKLPKSDFEWMIAERLFRNDETYADIFAGSTTTPKGRAQWVTKIKNKLTQLSASLSFHLSIPSLTYYSRMRKIVDDCSEMMGETGQGYTSEEEIEQANNEHLTRSWGESYPLMLRGLPGRTLTWCVCSRGEKEVPLVLYPQAADLRTPEHGTCWVGEQHN